MTDGADPDMLADATVRDRDGGRLGEVTSVHRSDGSDQPLFVGVRPDPAGPERLVPLQGAVLEDGVLEVVFDRETVQGSPAVPVDRALSDDERGSLFDYYDGRAGGVPSGVDGAPAGLPAAPAAPPKPEPTGADR